MTWDDGPRRPPDHVEDAPDAPPRARRITPSILIAFAVVDALVVAGVVAFFVAR